MERLTGRRDGRTYIVGCPDFVLPKIIGLIIQQTVDRLAAIEDILGDDYDLDRLRELVEADREGPCVVLPCKVGSPVWRVYDDCEFPGDCHTKQKCKGCEYRSIFAEEQAFCLSMLSQSAKLGHPNYASMKDAWTGIEGEENGKIL